MAKRELEIKEKNNKGSLTQKEKTLTKGK